MRYALLLLLILVAGAQAEMNGKRLPGVNSHVSEGVYQSTGTTSAGVLFVSSYPATLYAVVVSSPGGVGAKLELFDGSISTNGVRRLLQEIDVSFTSNVLPLIPFNIATSSGIAAYTSGAVAPRLDFIYRLR